MKIVMYTRTNPPCPFCLQAKQLAGSKNIEFENIDIGTDITMQEFRERFPNARAVPLILDDGVVIGGFNEFRNYILSTELGGLSI